MSVTLAEQFDNATGQWKGYDVYEAADRLRILRQRHVDIRNFVSQGALTEYRMFDLDQRAASSLNTLTMSALAGTRIHYPGESWSLGTVGKQPDRKNWNGISFSAPLGVETISTGTIPVPVNSGIEYEAIDILTEFNDDDFVTIALPAFNLTNIVLANSFVEFTSNVNGNFAAGPVASVPFSASIIPLVNGDSEFRILRSAITGIDLQKVTGVRFRINVTNTLTFRALAVRIIGKQWSFGAVDQDTRLNILKPTVSLNGSASAPTAFTFPTLWRAGEPAGADDPKPINVSIGIAFNSGSKVGTNTARLFFREGPGDFAQQLDLNPLTQATLNSYATQPTLATISYRGRQQVELDFFNQSDLTSDTQSEIELTVDPNIASYESAVIQWTSATTTITVSDSEGNGYTFSEGIAALSANSPYLFLVTLEDNSIRARLYPLDASGNIKRQRILYDTGRVEDEFIFARRPGRYGWNVNLQDGDAAIFDIVPRNQVYAEFQTTDFKSNTPVEGAELYVAGTPQSDYFENLFIAPYGAANATVTRDSDRSTTGASFRVDNPGTSPLQGLESNLADFYDFNQMEIEFDLYYPSSAINRNIGLEAFLTNDAGRIIPLQLGKILPDRWQTFRVAPGNIEAQTGRYRVAIVQTVAGGASTWWIDRFQIRERNLSFFARSTESDPWNDERADWVPFKNNINKDSGAVQFIERGKSLQLKAIAHRPDAFIEKIKIVPRYAQLGRFVWEEDELYNPQPPVSSFTFVVTGRTVTFDATNSTDPDGDIINYEWSFGEGDIDFGKIVSHTYIFARVYSVTLVVTDSNGLRASSTQDVTIL